VKLIDFGTAKFLHEIDEISFNTGNRGTLAYISPELQTWKPWDTCPIDLKACDMWSLGVTIYQTLTYELVVPRLPNMKGIDYNKALNKFFKKLKKKFKVDSNWIQLENDIND